MIDKITKLARKYITGIDNDYTLHGVTQPVYDFNQPLNLYIHIPFCKNLCPYCPYFKIKYDKKYAASYKQAVINEIKLCYGMLGKQTIGSIYIGGGTPTLLIDELSPIINEIHKYFNVKGELCIETHPKDLSCDVIRKMKNIGIDLVSLGIQSFNNKYLKLIGRNYDVDMIRPIIDNVINADFNSVNIDLIFALPGQSCEELYHDLASVTKYNVPQITAYPLFTFPYSSIGRQLGIKKVKRPNIINRRKQFKLLNEFFLTNGYERASIWSFIKEGNTRYSSSTRDKYLGLGAGAASHTDRGFYLNTFSVDAYIERCKMNKWATSLYMPFTELMQSYFWLYWRLYDTKVNKKQVSAKFNSDFTKLYRILKILKHLQLLREDDDFYELNEKGAFWLHLLQNNILLKYVDSVWTLATKEPWPKEIKL